MTMSMNGRTATTDENGNYTITGLVGSGSVIGTLSAPNCDTVSARKDNITGSSNSVNLSVDNNKYAYWLFQKGYQNLRANEYGYKIETIKGYIEPQTSMAGPQYSYSQKHKDKNGVYLVENKNHGDPVSIVKVDPRVDLVGYYDSKASSTNMQYKFINCKNMGDGALVSHKVVEDKVRAETVYDYSKQNFTNISISDFTGTYGFGPTGFYSYNINSSTVLSLSAITKAANGDLSFKMCLSTDNACVSNYLKQMNAFSGQTPTFSNIELTYTLDKFGNLKTNSIYEKYTVKQVITVDIKAYIIEQFTTYNSTNYQLVNKSAFGN